MFVSIQVSVAFFFLCSAMSVIATIPCFVDSSHDGNGLYSYTFRRGDAPYVWGLDPNGEFFTSGIVMQFYGIREIAPTPGWSNLVSSDGLISWSPSGERIFLDEPVTFSIRSCLTETATYDNGWPGPYTRGGIVGMVYALPGRTNAVGGGFQTFIFTGPTRPKLFVEREENYITLSWSLLARECQLESCDSLQLPQIWTPVTNAPFVSGTNYTVVLPTTNSTRVFRLTIENVK